MKLSVQFLIKVQLIVYSRKNTNEMKKIVHKQHEIKAYDKTIIYCSKVNIRKGKIYSPHMPIKL